MAHSNSSLNCFANCMAKYEHNYILHTPPCKPVSPHLTFGTMAHEVLYNAGYRMLDGEENEVLTDAVDATFRGAVLRLAEKLKERIRDVVFISKDEIINWDILIDETAQKFLTCET